VRLSKASLSGSELLSSAKGEASPVLAEFLAGRMEQIADEMDATLLRAAFNPIVAESHDASHGLYRGVTGDTPVQGKSGLPVFVGSCPSP